MVALGESWNTLRPLALADHDHRGEVHLSSLSGAFVPYVKKDNGANQTGTYVRTMKLETAFVRAPQG